MINKYLFLILIGIIIFSFAKDKIEKFSDELKTKCNNFLNKNIYSKLFENDNDLKSLYKNCWDTEGDYINIINTLKNNTPTKFYLTNLSKNYKNGSCKEDCKKKLCSVRPNDKFFKILVNPDEEKYEYIGAFGCPNGQPPTLEYDISLSGCDNNTPERCDINDRNKYFNVVLADNKSRYHYSNPRNPHPYLE